LESCIARDYRIAYRFGKMNGEEIRPAIEGLPEHGILDAHCWTLFYEERAKKGAILCRFSQKVSIIWEIMETAAHLHKPGNIARWNWMSVSDLDCSILFREDGQTVPNGDFQRFKETVEQEKINQQAIDRLTRAPEEIILIEI